MTPMSYVLSFMGIVAVAIAVGGYMSWRDRARMQSELARIRTERMKLQEEEAKQDVETISRAEKEAELAASIEALLSPNQFEEYDADLLERITRRKEVQRKIRNIVSKHAERSNAGVVFVRNAVFETENPLRSVRQHLKGSVAR